MPDALHVLYHPTPPYPGLWAGTVIPAVLVRTQSLREDISPTAVPDWCQMRVQRPKLHGSQEA